MRTRCHRNGALTAPSGGLKKTGRHTRAKMRSWTLHQKRELRDEKRRKRAQARLAATIAAEEDARAARSVDRSTDREARVGARVEALLGIDPKKNKYPRGRIQLNRKYQERGRAATVARHIKARAFHKATAILNNEFDGADAEDFIALIRWCTTTISHQAKQDRGAGVKARARAMKTEAGRAYAAAVAEEAFSRNQSELELGRVGRDCAPGLEALEDAVESKVADFLPSHPPSRKDVFFLCSVMIPIVGWQLFLHSTETNETETLDMVMDALDDDRLLTHTFPFLTAYYDWLTKPVFGDAGEHAVAMLERICDRLLPPRIDYHQPPGDPPRFEDPATRYNRIDELVHMLRFVRMAGAGGLCAVARRIDDTLARMQKQTVRTHTILSTMDIPRTRRDLAPLLP